MQALVKFVKVAAFRHKSKNVSAVAQSVFIGGGDIDGVLSASQQEHLRRLKHENCLTRCNGDRPSSGCRHCSRTRLLCDVEKPQLVVGGAPTTARGYRSWLLQKLFYPLKSMRSHRVGSDSRKKIVVFRTSVVFCTRNLRRNFWSPKTRREPHDFRFRKQGIYSVEQME